MIKYLAGAALAIALLTGCTAKPHVPIYYEKVRPTIISVTGSQQAYTPVDATRRELGKWDDWINDLINQTNLYWQETRNFYVMRTIASYDRNANAIHVPNNTSKDMDAIDHEIAHRMLDIRDKNCILFSKGYEGPSWADTVDMTQKRMAQPGMWKLYEKYKTLYEALQARKTAVYLQDTVISRMMDLNRTFWNIRNAIERVRKVAVEECDKTALQSCEKQYASVISGARENTERIKKSLDEFIGDENTLMGLRENSPEESLKRAKEEAERHLGELRELNKTYKMLVSEAQTIRTDLERVDNEIAIKDLNQEMQTLQKSLQEAKSDEEKKRIGKQISEKRARMEFIETFDTSYRTLQRIRKKRYVKEDIKIAELELLAAMEKERFVKDFFSPDEIVARMVDSLMSCYVGEDTANLYALTDEECGTFRKMTLDGKPMFKKALEKHELGKALLKKGYKPHEIRAMLEYATYYSDGESAHVWPETSVGLVIRDKPKHGKPNKQNRRKTPPKKNERRPRNSL